MTSEERLVLIAAATVIAGYSADAIARKVIKNRRKKNAILKRQAEAERVKATLDILTVAVKRARTDMQFWDIVNHAM